MLSDCQLISSRNYSLVKCCFEYPHFQFWFVTLIFEMDTISIIGLGLIGGSLGLALKKYNSGIKIKGYSRRFETTEVAVKMGTIDIPAPDLKNAVSEVSLVIIATPVLTIESIMQQIASYIARPCIVSDTGSTKSQVMEWAHKYLPGNVSFVGGHPMAGKEKSGIEAADANLFQNAVYCLTPDTHADKKATSYLKELVQSIKANPVVIDARVHDHLVAAISHLPFVLSEALMAICSKDSNWSEMAKLASSGFRDTTRLASGDPVMYKDICATNQQEITHYIDELIKELQKIKTLIDKDPNSLEPIFKAARQARENWLKGK